MKRLFTVSSSSKYASHAIYPYKNLLSVSEKDAPYSWGIFLKESSGDIFQKKRPYSMDGTDFFDFITTHKISHGIANITQKPEKHSLYSTMPFKYRNWHFSMIGESGMFDTIKDWMLGSLPSFLKRSINGNSEQEHVFYLLVSFLYDTGLINAYEPSLEALAASIQSTYDIWKLFVNEVSQTDGPDTVMALTNGNLTAVMSSKNGLLGYKHIENIESPCPYCLDKALDEDADIAGHENVNTLFTFADENIVPEEIGLISSPVRTVLIFADNRLKIIPLYSS